MGTIKIGKIYKTAIYLRVSREDETGSESCSIANQRELLTAFVNSRNDLELTAEFTDDGYSGYDFTRPQFQAMLKAAKMGDIDCIVVKDLSRLGRNFLKVEEYTQIVFASLGIRFISIGNDIDSLREKSFNDRLATPITNLANEFHVAETSRKIRDVQRSKRENGVFIGNFCCYGYVKFEKEIQVDTEAAEVVKEIFRLKISGYCNQGIADLLEQQGVLCPMEYKLANGQPVSSGLKRNEKAKWTSNTVRRILENPVYTGTLIQGKTTTPSYKDKHRYEKDKSEWSIFDGHHEAIISESIFQIVQSLPERDSYSNTKKQSYLFSGFAFCGNCNEQLVHRATKYKDNVYYTYSCYNKECKKHCNIREKSLIYAVEYTLKAHLRIVADYDLVLSIREELPEQDENYDTPQVYDKYFDEQIRQITDMQGFLSDEVNQGKICQTEYTEMLGFYAKRLAEIAFKKDELRKKRQKLIADGNEIIRRFREYTEFTELTREIVTLFIEKIIVESADSIRIVFRYADLFQGVQTTNNKEVDNNGS